MRNVLRVVWPTVKRYLTYGATVAIAVFAVTFNPVLALQAGVIGGLALYLVFCAAFHAVVAYEMQMEAASMQYSIDTRAKAIEALQAKPSGRGPRNLPDLDQIGTDSN